MVEKSLIFIKHHFTFLWRLIERANSFIFLLLYSTTMEKVLASVFMETTLPLYTFRKLGLKDLNLLYDLIHEQSPADIEYFHPHGFDLKSIRKQFSNSSFLMMGVFFRQKLVGYFFLRFFANKKCFVGRLIDQHYRGQGIGRVMNNIMYETFMENGISLSFYNLTAEYRCYAGTCKQSQYSCA